CGSGSVDVCWRAHCAASRRVSLGMEPAVTKYWEAASRGELVDAVLEGLRDLFVLPRDVALVFGACRVVVELDRIKEFGPYLRRQWELGDQRGDDAEGQAESGACWRERPPTPPVRTPAPDVAHSSAARASARS